MSLFDTLVVKTLPLTPKAIVRRFAARYVAGETLDQAMATVERLRGWGAMATIDVLGEDITRFEESLPTRDAYLAVLDEIKKRGVAANVSVKLTAFGLRQDDEGTYRNVRAVVERALAAGNFVRIDMEDATVTTKTLDIFRRLRADGFRNVGVVLQAYLKRTLADVVSLGSLSPVANYRLCKGIYVESADVAIKDPLEINRNYLKVLETMLDGGSYVGIATHDRRVVAGAQEIIKRLGLTPDRYEFQMLLGVEEGLGRELVAAGHRLRIYVPYGKDWYAYCMRRLKENPRIARYVIAALFKAS